MLTKDQKKMVTEAIGDGSDWPKMTDDPQVNCAVDVVVCDTKPWEQLTEEVKGHYIEEVEAFKVRQGIFPETHERRA